MKYSSICNLCLCYCKDMQNWNPSAFEALAVKNVTISGNITPGRGREAGVHIKVKRC